MGKQKEPLDAKQIARLTNEANKHPEDSDMRKAFYIFRYTGCHVSVLTNPDRKLREETTENGTDIDIVWQRPKKKGGWAYTRIAKHPRIGFNVSEFAAEIYQRKRKNTPKYFNRLMRTLGEEAGIPDVSPMSFRHSLCIELLDAGMQPHEVAHLLNVHPQTLAWYGRRTKKGMRDKLEMVGWLNK